MGRGKSTSGEFELKVKVKWDFLKQFPGVLTSTSVQRPKVAQLLFLSCEHRQRQNGLYTEIKSIKSPRSVVNIYLSDEKIMTRKVYLGGF